jgi:glycosyltransferase involved in cell wall biosynthesis
MIICSPQYGLRHNSFVGGEVYDEKILKGLADKGHKIEIILPYKKTYDKTQKNWNVTFVPIPFLHYSYLFNFATIPLLVKIYKKTKFDVLRVHSPYLTGIGAFIFKKLFAKNIKVVATYHHLENKILFNIIDKFIANKWDLIITVSKFTKSQLIEKYKIDPDKIIVAYNGVDKKYIPGEKDQKTINKYKLNGKFVLVFCGTISKRKNVIFLLDVMAKLKGGSTVLVVVGG